MFGAVAEIVPAPAAVVVVVAARDAIAAAAPNSDAGLVDDVHTPARLDFMTVPGR